MTFRIADNTSSSNFTSRINVQRGRLSVLQEQISTGKRINRPSDDPSGTQMVLKLRTSQTEIGQFQRNAQTANQKLTAGDNALEGYDSILERVKALVTQGLSDTTTQQARNGMATEIESLRVRILSIANATNGDEYVFGGTRQNAPPFDPTTAVPANTPTSAQFIQIEPGANAIASGITAETVFRDATSTVFTDLTNAVNALRGTGNPTADRATLQNTIIRMGAYTDLANNVRVTLSSNMKTTEVVGETLGNNFVLLDERVSSIEGADFAETAVGFADAQRALDATLQIAARGRRSLFDFLG